MHFFLKILQMHLKICLQLHICKSVFVFKAVRPHSAETYLGRSLVTIILLWAPAILLMIANWETTIFLQMVHYWVAMWW